MTIRQTGMVTAAELPGVVPYHHLHRHLPEVPSDLTGHISEKPSQSTDITDAILKDCKAARHLVKARR